MSNKYSQYYDGCVRHLDDRSDVEIADHGLNEVVTDNGTQQFLTTLTSGDELEAMINGNSPLEVLWVSMTGGPAAPYG